MLKKLRDFLTMRKNRKSTNIAKEECRGIVKQIMKVRGLRTISLENYNNWKGVPRDTNGIHSVKLDIMSGYLNIFGYDFVGKNKKPVCSSVAIEDAPAEVYQYVYGQVKNILADEDYIPYRVKKNILVRVAR